MKRRHSHITIYLLIVILIIAAILRLRHINQPLVDAFSWRQASTAMIGENFYRGSWNIFFPEVSWNGPGPSYQGREFQTISYISALIYLLVGQQDWVGRGVAVIFGLWGIFALYQLVRRVWDEEHALVSVAVMAVLPGSIFIERSFLPDPAMVALVITAFWMFVAYLQTDRWFYLLLADIIGVWGFLTKIPGLIIGLPMAYTMLAIWGHQIWHKKKLIPLTTFAVLMLAPVAAYYLWARHLALSYPPYHFAGSGNWLWDAGPIAWLQQGYFLSDLSTHFNLWLWSWPAIILVGLGLIFRPQVDGSGLESRPTGQSYKAPWVFHWWLLAGVIFYLIGAKELVSNPWNFHIINPAAAALAAHAILLISNFIGTTIRRSSLSYVTIAVIILFLGGIGQMGVRWMYYPYADQSYQMGLALREISQPGDLVVTIANDVGDPVAIYYSSRRGWVFPPAGPHQDWGQLPEDERESIRIFDELRANGAQWLGIVESQQMQLEQDYPGFAEYIKRTSEVNQANQDWVIYRILTPQEISNLTP